MKDRMEWIDRYARGAELIERAVQGLSEEELRYVPAPGAWSAKEIVIHMADSETVVVDRMKRVIAEERPPLRTMYQELWTRRLRYAELDHRPYLPLFKLLRETMAGVLRTLDEADFERVGVHDELGDITLQGLIVRYAEHAENHAAQIERNAAAFRRSRP